MIAGGQVNEEVERIFTSVNMELAQYETIKKFEVLLSMEEI